MLAILAVWQAAPNIFFRTVGKIGGQNRDLV
jgi:hypothetical protein